MSQRRLELLDRLGDGLEPGLDRVQKPYPPRRVLDEQVAARSYELTGLGYLGVDIVLDAELGPLILELNARPGLNIQIANRSGLQERLERITAEPNRDVAARVRFVADAFAG